MFSRVLVANRGEIAARIIRGCHALGVQAVAVYSEADAESPHLELADDRVLIGGAHASASYLNQNAILAAAHAKNCQALHPGYGFLSENAIFAARCRQERITFIGPTPENIRVMGNKILARQEAGSFGLAGVPGSEDPLGSAAEAERLADQLGYPVLLKAAYGGGGRGMRIVREKREMKDCFETATSEAAAAFGDGALYLEVYVEGGRHIEVQLLGTGDGGAIHLGERECSIQRNYQKLIEEAPSPALDRRRAAEFASKVAFGVGFFVNYRSAGTVEFLLDPQRDALYFMEMNTRLQVEHPVTEMVTGVDIVASQIRIAANEELTLESSETLDGHAIECRINAEDPARNFRPSAGKITRLRWPEVGAGLRIDTHIAEGYEIPPFYDSMLAKIIAHAPTREQAIAKMQRALGELVIEGVPTTAALHQRILATPEFASGNYSTQTLAAMLARDAAAAGARP